MAIEIVEKKREGDYLFITVQGESVMEVTASSARKFAYEARGEFGFDNAGIESFGGPFPVDVKAKDENKKAGKPLADEDMREISARPKDLAYRNTFRVTRSPI